MAVRKVLTRAESQAQTREAVLESAERLFLQNGYYATTIAAIAAEAGRTIGAVYSNYDNKQALCLEVLKDRYSAEAADLLGRFAGADDSLDARLKALSEWWSQLSGETALFTLAAEYLIGVIRDSGQQSDTEEVLERARRTGRVLAEALLPTEGVSKGLIDDAVEAIVASGVGLAAGRSADIIDAERSAKLLAVTIRMWLERLAAAGGVEGGASAAR